MLELKLELNIGTGVEIRLVFFIELTFDSVKERERKRKCVWGLVFVIVNIIERLYTIAGEEISCCYYHCYYCYCYYIYTKIPVWKDDLEDIRCGRNYSIRSLWTSSREIRRR